MLSNQYNESFQKEIARLNPAQRKAVESLDGPVLVLAGPGTGKTQILSARIGNILLQTDTKPHNILCLTYTDAGTIAMRQRLLKFIGPDAYRVNIFTFHAFCNMVIQENLDHFGIRGLQPASDIEIVETLHDLIDHFAADNPLKRFTGEVYYETGNLRSLFEVMKKEGWSATYIEDKIEEYLADLPNRPEYIYVKPPKGKNKGDLKEAEIQKEHDKMNKLRAAAKEFSSYEQKMLKLRRYDYHDMILWVLDAFRNHPHLLLQYQERYHYFLVDEYQDTNGSQNEILNLLSSYWEKPNVFVVGDDDQSIFRFQGANVKNITDFTFKHREHLEIVVLTENYRSSQQILDLSSALIRNNEERLVNKVEGLSKDLVASGENGKSLVQPVLTEYYSVLHEELATVNAIEDLVAQGVDLSEVAVIYRSHRMVESIVKMLQNRNVPLNIKQRINILELPLVLNIINILSYLQEEYDRPDNAEFRLFEFMHYDFFGISPRDAAKISREVYESSRSESKRLKWREVIGSRETLFRMGLETSSKISALEDNLMYWVKELKNMTVQSLFEKILTKGGILTWVMNQPDKIHLMQVITTFFDFIKEESARRNNFTLEQLLEQLDKMIRNELAIPLDRSVHSEHGVNFVTAHSSKGLEFNHVFLIGCNSKNWEKKRGNNNSFSFPDTLTDSTEENKEEEERRLFYVALTRARIHLHVSWSANDKGGKPAEKSSFVAELMEGNTIEVQHKHLSDREIVDAQAELMMSLQAPVIELLDKGYIRKKLENYKLSVTHLNKYLKCPLSFYFENIVQVPTARSESMGFGSAVHFALETLYIKMTEHPEKEFPSLEEFLNSFAWGMKMYHSHFTPAQMKRRLQYGEQILPPLYEKCTTETNKDVLIEYALHGIEVNGVPITGKLDKVELDNGSVTVVDYKTGKYENGKKKLPAPSEKDPKGGDYWRQVVFYRILLDNDKRRNLTMTSGEIFFVEPDPKQGYIREKIYVTQEDIQLVKTQIATSWKSIQNMEFDKGCGEEDCAWCNFVKHNYKIIPHELPVNDEE